MYECSCKLVGISPISFGKAILEKKAPNESHDDHEQRTWRQRLHVDSNGQVFVPPMALKNCLTEAAKFQGDTIPGKGKATYTKRFLAGTLVTDRLMLANGKPIQGDDVEAMKLFVPSDGKPGGGTRVWKYFPTIPEGWNTEATVTVIDEIIPPDKVEEYLQAAGQFIGLGALRVGRGGYHGRFIIEDFQHTKSKK